MLLYNFFHICENKNFILLGFIISLIFGLICIIHNYKKNMRLISKLYAALFIIITFIFFSLGLRLSFFYYLIYLVIDILLGNIVAQKIFHMHGKSLLWLYVDFLLGFYGLGIIFFIVSQRAILEKFGYSFNRIFMFAIYGLIIFYYILHRKNFIRDIEDIKSKLKNYDTLILISIALISSYFIVFNLNNVFTWSWLYDKTIHIKTVFIEDFIKYKSFPFDKLYPFGFQEAIYIPTIISHNHIYSMVSAYDFFGFLNLLCAFVIPFEFAKALKSNKLSCYLAAILAIFFGAIGGPFINAYLGFINISTSIYHNTTEFFALTPAMLFVYFAYVWYTDNNRNISYAFLSIAFLDFSFLTKPNAYMICAPVICILLLIFFIMRKMKFINAMLSYALTFLPLLYWTIYPKIANIKSTSSIPPELCSFGYIYNIYFLKKFHHYFFSNVYYTIFIVITLSIIGIVLPMIFSSYQNKKAKKFYYCFLFPVFIICILVACMIVQGDAQKDDGNYMWQISLIGVSIMPFIAKFTEDIKNKLLRNFVYVVLILHIVSGGLWHLLILNLCSSL